MKTEKLKQKFLQNYTPGNYTDEEFGEMASEFEKNLDELLNEVSRNMAIEFRLFEEHEMPFREYWEEKFDEWKSN